MAPRGFIGNERGNAQRCIRPGRHTAPRAPDAISPGTTSYLRCCRFSTLVVSQLLWADIAPMDALSDDTGLVHSLSSRIHLSTFKKINITYDYYDTFVKARL